jgi:acyl dehydratase
MAWTFEDVQEGQALPPFVVDKLTRTDLVRYAGASGDFNPSTTTRSSPRRRATRPSSGTAC